MKKKEKKVKKRERKIGREIHINIIYNCFLLLPWALRCITNAAWYVQLFYPHFSSKLAISLCVFFSSISVEYWIVFISCESRVIPWNIRAYLSSFSGFFYQIKKMNVLKKVTTMRLIRFYVKACFVSIVSYRNL